MTQEKLTEGTKHFLFGPQELKDLVEETRKFSDKNGLRFSYDQYMEENIGLLDRFYNCKKALRAKQLLMLAEELRDKEFISKFAEILNTVDVRITFANLTNIAEWIPVDTLREIMALLPVHEEAIILFSSQPNIDLVMRKICRGPREYFKELVNKTD